MAIKKEAHIRPKPADQTGEERSPPSIEACFVVRKYAKIYENAGYARFEMTNTTN